MKNWQEQNEREKSESSYRFPSRNEAFLNKMKKKKKTKQPCRLFSVPLVVNAETAAVYLTGFPEQQMHLVFENR